MSRLQGVQNAQGPVMATTHETEEIFVAGNPINVDAPI